MPEKGEKLLNLTDADYKNIKTWSGIGLTNAQIAGCLSVSLRTFEQELTDNETLREVIHNARSNAVAYVTGKLWGLIEKNDKAAIFFYLKCRGGWRETVNVATKGDGKFTFVKSNGEDKI